MIIHRGPSLVRRRGWKRIVLAVVLAELLLLTGLVVAFARQTSTVSTPHVTPEDGIVLANVTYCTAGGMDLKLDLYLPPALDARLAPVAIYIHGGGWQEGDKNWIDRILPAGRLVARGYAVAAVNYRLAPWSLWPAQIADVKCAVRFLRAHAAAYHLDPDHIGVWGESAGGHLAAMLGLAGPAAGFDNQGGYADQSSAVQAVVDLCGPADFADLDLSLADRVQAQLLLGTQPDADLLRRISPTSYARADAPPFLIVHGDQDTLVPPAHSQHLAAALQAVGAPATLVMVKNAGHVFAPAGTAPISPTVAEIDQMALDFFDTHLQPTIAATRTFTPTGKTVRGVFLAYWQAHGGVPALGYPVSEAISGTLPLGQAAGPGQTPAVLQYFQRAVLTLPTATVPTVDAVQVLPLGTLAYRQEYPGGAPGQVPDAAPGSVVFAATGHRLGGPFLAYWQAHNGAATLGPPISDEFAEVSALDGQRHIVQYFAQGALERHPENAAPYDVLPAALGTLAWQQASAALAPPTAAP